MNTTTEQKMLQAIIFIYEISVCAIGGLFDYCVFPQCNVQDLQEFVNENPNKHSLFHLHYNELPCCGCPEKFHKTGRQILRKEQFDILLKHTNQNQRHVTKTTKGYITQDCLCNYEAKTSLTLNDLDITLMVKILTNCCKKYFQPPVISWLENIRKIRNLVFHAGGLNFFEESDLDQMLQNLETLVLKITGQVPHQRFQTCIKTQIRLLKCTTIYNEGARNIIAKTECIIEAEKQDLIDLINGKALQHETRMDKLHQETLQCYKEGTSDLKNSIAEHFEDSKMNQDYQTIQMKQGLDEMGKNVKENRKAMTNDIKRLNEEMNTELKDNQDEIKETQKHHTVKLTTIENISEDVLKTATNTKHEQSKQTSVMAIIQGHVEKLDAKALDEDDKAGLKKLKDSFDRIKNFTDVLGGRDVGCQTDIENMQFELGETSKTLLESIRTVTKTIQTQNDDIRIQNDDTKEKLSEVLKNTELFLSEKTTSSLTDPGIEESITSNAISVYETFMWKVFKLKAELDKNHSHSKFLFSSNWPVMQWLILPSKEKRLEKAKEKVEVLKPAISSYMNTLRSLIEHYVNNDTMSPDASESLLMSAFTNLSDIKMKVKELCELFDNVNKCVWESEVEFKRYLSKVLSYLHYVERCIDKPLFAAEEQVESTHITMINEKLSYTACTCFIDLFAFSIFLDFYV